MKRAVIFDFGGVLMKTVNYAPRHAWDARLGLEPGSVERIIHNDDSWVKAQTDANAIDAYWRDVATQLKLTDEEVQKLAVDFYSGDQLDQNIVSYIRDLRANGHQVALLSNDSVELLPKLERLGITSLFDPLVVSAHIGVMKPAPEAYQAVLGRLNRPADETIFIDDRLENIQGAAAVGIHGIHYKNVIDLPAALTNLLRT